MEERNALSLTSVCVKHERGTAGIQSVMYIYIWHQKII